MKKQILVIHGGDTFQRYEDYLNYLKTKQTSLVRIKSTSWKDHLGKDLGDPYEVICPKMPNAQNARYEEWEIWFEKILSLLNDELILIGHSLGGIFLMKYLSKHSTFKKIKALFLIAAPFDDTEDPNLKEFSPCKDFTKLLDTKTKIIFFHSKDDFVVPFNEVLKYQKALPYAEIKVFEDKGHFNQENFPDLIVSIRSCS